MKGVGLRVVDSHTGNHRQDDFTPLETIQRFLDIIESRSLSSSNRRPSSWRGGSTIKAQVLKDFLLETQEEDEETDFQNQEGKPKDTRWRLYTDESSSDDGYGAGLMIVSPEGMEFTYALKFKFTATNNEAEYEAVITCLRIAIEMKIEEIMNKKADALSKLASLTFEHLTKKVLVEKLENKSIYEKQEADVTTKEEDNLMTTIVEYLISGILLADQKLENQGQGTELSDH
ncbi:reverse transcriptase domain-containing protein [Tanacetum coccineum]|uniref:Reverse transcriptase domain-containing protein n=1 Tax=Tanacetum coccineum TaxID=301880 RepID=A0ABQ5C456_9ASTR